MKKSKRKGIDISKPVGPRDEYARLTNSEKRWAHRLKDDIDALNPRSRAEWEAEQAAASR